ncbi:MAG: 50S ribosomal protein L11 methyltransferase [Pseudomonadota bacterium]
MSPATTVSLTTQDCELAHEIAAALQDLIEPAPDALTIFEEPRSETQPDWRIDAYYTDPPETSALRQSLAQVLDADIPELTSAPVPDLNWVAMSQAALPPVIAGRFTVHGSHDRGRVGRKYYGLEIEAGEAFGTAHHATTFGCLKAIDRLTQATPQSPAKVLDLGCGSGVLAIAVARCWPRAHVTATDIDARSCVVARENAVHNRVASRINVYLADGASDPRLKKDGPFDVIVANILAGPLIQITADIASIIKPGGTLILSGILIHQAPSVIAAYRASGFVLCDHQRITEWSTLTLRRRNHLSKRLAPAMTWPD